MVDHLNPGATADSARHNNTSGDISTAQHFSKNNSLNASGMDLTAIKDAKYLDSFREHASDPNVSVHVTRKAATDISRSVANS